MCLGFCGINVTVERGRDTKIAGDVTSPLTQGFTCSKGRAIPEQLARPDRLLGALRYEFGERVEVFCNGAPLR